MPQGRRTNSAYKLQTGQPAGSGHQKGLSSTEDQSNKSSLKMSYKLQETLQNEKFISFERTRHPSTLKEEPEGQPKTVVAQSPQRWGSIQSYRDLLPDYLKFKLPEDLAHLCRIGCKIDKYLQGLPKKQLGQSFNNLRAYLAEVQGMEIGEAHLEQINYLLPTHYSYYRDPLGNLIVDYPRQENVHIRGQNLRRMLYNWQLEAQKSQTAESPRPKKLLTKRTTQFYPIKKIRKLQCQQPKIQKQFLQTVLDYVSEKQEEQSQVVPAAEALAAEQLEKQREEVRNIYSEKQVASIYKATLVQLLDQRLGCGLPCIIKGLDTLLKAKDELKLVEINGKKIVRYEPENMRVTPN